MKKKIRKTKKFKLFENLLKKIKIVIKKKLQYKIKKRKKKIQNMIKLRRI